MYIKGKEPLLSMAYFCFTHLLNLAERDKGKGKRKEKASEKFYIEDDVLNKLGCLSSARGDKTTARKSIENSIPLTAIEEKWVKDCIKLIIRRVGEININPKPNVIKMSDLPQL